MSGYAVAGHHRFADRRLETSSLQGLYRTELAGIGQRHHG
jgi:hypothetical protein